MVTQGKFTVQIINAETDEPFKEHVSTTDFKTYVEVEPEVEYYIRVSGTNGIDALVHVEVDQVSVGYCSKLPAYSNESLRMGCRNAKGDITSFLFRKTLIDHNDGNAERRIWTGTVRANIYVCVPNTEVDYGYHDHEGKGWHKGEVGATLGVTPLNQKKGVYSDHGDAKLQTNVQWGKRYKNGPKLEEINLIYCSTVGLIHFGLLPNPVFQLLAQDAGDGSRRKRAKQEPITVDLFDDDE